ncbi:MAG: hypothetical protein QG673_89 [Pseudomonadota bacterium]|nr:hypothetical protein [Pseudomonadota bacterium]
MSEKITDLILGKFVNDEIMTKSDLDRRLDEIMTRHLGMFEAKLNIRFDHIDRRFEDIDRRFEDIDRRFEQVDCRFGLMDAKIDHLELRLTGIENRFRWLIGVLTTASISILFGMGGFLIKIH